MLYGYVIELIIFDVFINFFQCASLSFSCLMSMLAHWSYTDITSDIRRLMNVVMYCLKYLMSMLACWHLYFLQEPPWSASLLGPPCPRPAHQDYWQAWKDRWCLKEAISYIYQSWPYYCVGSCPNSLDKEFLFRQYLKWCFALGKSCSYGTLIYCIVQCVFCNL